MCELRVEMTEGRIRAVQPYWSVQIFDLYLSLALQTNTLVKKVHVVICQHEVVFVVSWAYPFFSKNEVRSGTPLLFSGLGSLFLLFVVLFSQPIQVNLSLPLRALRLNEIPFQILFFVRIFLGPSFHAALNGQSWERGTARSRSVDWSRIYV